MTRRTAYLPVFLALVAALGSGCKKANAPGTPAAPLTTVRVGFFPNLTHAVPLVALARGDFERALAPAKVEGKPFNAGPEAMEALFAGALDATYVGPAPAISGYLRSHGEGLVVVAGAAENGAALVVRKDSGIKSAADLHGKKLASPQLGNTQDVALRIYLRDNGLQTKEKGGDVQVLPVANADILSLMKQKQIDGAWVPEPWTTRLIHEADATILVDERERWPDKRFPITLLVVTRKLQTEHPEVVQKLVAANSETVRWIQGHRDEARKLVDDGLFQWAKKRLPPEVLDEAWTRVEVSDRLDAAAIDKQLKDARSLNFLPAQGDINGMIDRHFLDAASGAAGPAAGQPGKTP
jgi:NitT/TauT family transport system substrate-binding protein